jgi:hypothetical protein
MLMYNIHLNLIAHLGIGRNRRVPGYCGVTGLVWVAEREGFEPSVPL